MCGILAIIGSPIPASELRKRAVLLSAKLRHRGPDWSGVCVQEVKHKSGADRINILAHERLAIVDPANGAQPLFNETKDVALIVNGEIYNHKELRKTLKSPRNFKTSSDSEVLVYLFEEEKDDFINKIDGIFSFVISDKKNNTFLAARDPIGVTPLYVGWGRDGSLWFASEMKALCEDCERFEEFPPGHYWSSSTGCLKRWYNPPWFDEHIPNGKLELDTLRSLLEKSVIKRLMTDVPYGVLLSGGLDSSLVASIASRHALMRIEEDEQTRAWWPRLHSFAIGLEGSPDLKAARVVADFLGTAHHEFIFTVEEGLDAIDNVVYHLETYDVTTIRASTPMYFMSRKIKAMGVKMVLSGEGSDEIFGGYLYFHKAPSAEKFHVETCQKIKNLSKYDCLRANKSTSAWGVEVRCPFLDKAFLDYAMSIDPSEKMIKDGKMEKYILRKAFDDPKNPWLPSNILWRQKEQFSDGVGYSWIDSLRKFAESEVTDEQMELAAFRFPYNPPATKEAYYYRTVFQKHFGMESAAKTVAGGPSIACSTPAAIEWDLAWKNRADPSGRSISGVHVAANETTATK